MPEFSWNFPLLSGENCIVTVAGANMKMTPSAVEQAEGVIQGASVMVCQAEITPAATLTALRLAQKHKGEGQQSYVNAFLITLGNFFILCLHEYCARIY